MSCKFFSERIYYIVHIGLNQKIGIWRANQNGIVGDGFPVPPNMGFRI